MVILNKLKSKILSNSLWLILEKVVSIIGLVLVTSYVAKYIGPENFGKISYAMSIFAVVQTLAIWGTDTICAKRLSRKRESGIKLLVAASKIRLTIFFITCIPILSYFYFNADYLSFIFATAIAITTFIFIQDIYLIYNDVALNSKLNTICNIIGLVISLIIRYLIVEFKMPIAFLAIPIVIVSLIPFLLRKIFFIKECGYIKLEKREKNVYSKYILPTGITLALSSVAVAIYVNISQFMLGYLDSKASLGVYAVGITLGSTWMFVNLAFLTSYTPKLYQCTSEKDAFQLCSLVAKVMILLSLLYTITFYLLGPYIIHYLYGKEYSNSFYISLIIILGAFLSSLGHLYTKLIFLHNGFSYLMKKTIFVAIFGLLLGYILVVKYKILGAAISYVIIELLSLTILNYFFKDKLILKAHKYIFFSYRDSTNIKDS